MCSYLLVIVLVSTDSREPTLPMPVFAREGVRGGTHRTVPVHWGYLGGALAPPWTGGGGRGHGWPHLGSGRMVNWDDTGVMTS